MAEKGSLARKYREYEEFLKSPKAPVEETSETPVEEVSEEVTEVASEDESEVDSAPEAESPKRSRKFFQTGE